MIYYLACAIIGYLIGSIPFGYILVKLKKGVDIRKLGSGNIGATNVARVLGVPWGILCFLLDTAKGYIPTAYIITYHPFYHPIISSYSSNGETTFFSVIWAMSPAFGIPIGVGIIMGHLFPLYLQFRGGKGVATSLGVFMAIVPISTFIAFVIWLIFFVALRYVSVSSIIAAISLPLTSLIIYDYSFRVQGLMLYRNIYIVITCFIASILIITKHIPNIKRLIAGTEPKVMLWGKKPQTAGTDEHK